MRARVSIALGAALTASLSLAALAALPESGGAAASSASPAAPAGAAGGGHSVFPLVPQPGTGVVLHSGSSLVTPLNLDSMARAGSLAIGNELFAVAVTPDGSEALAARYGAGTVTPVDMAHHVVGAAIRVGSGPNAIAVDPAGTEAYVTDGLANAVTPIDLRTNEPGRSIRLPNGAKPQGIAISPDGKTAYVTDGGLDEVSPIDLGTGQVERPIRVGKDPYAIAVNISGTVAYVTNYQSASVSVIRLATRKIVTAVAVGAQPDGIALTGAAAYVACWEANETDVISLRVLRLADRLSTGLRPAAVVISPRGTTAYVANFGDGRGTVASIDTGTHEVTGVMAVGSGPSAFAVDTAYHRLLLTDYTSGTLGFVATGIASSSASVRLPSAAGAAAITGEGATAWICLPGRHEIVPVSLTGQHADTVGKPIFIGGRPTAIVIASHLGRPTAWIVDSAHDKLVEVDLGSRSVRERIGAGNGPDAIALAPNGSIAYLADAGTPQILPIDLATGRAQPAIKVTGEPASIAVSPDGSTLMVVNRRRGVVIPVDLRTRTAGAAISLPGVTSVAYGASALRAYAVSSTSDALFAIRLGVPVERISRAGIGPISVVAEAAAPIALVLDRTGASVTEIDLQDGHVFWTTRVGRRPSGLAAQLLPIGR